MILTSLKSDEAVEEVYTELFAGQEGKSEQGDGIHPGGSGRSTIFVDTSTVSLSSHLLLFSSSLFFFFSSSFLLSPYFILLSSSFL